MVQSGSSKMGDSLGVPAGLSLSPNASPKRPIGTLALGAVVLTLAAGAAVYAVRGRERSPARLSASETGAPEKPAPAPPVAETAASPANRATVEPTVTAAPASLTVRLAIPAPGAMVHVDEHAVPVENGTVELRGPLGSVRKVTVSKGGHVVTKDVVIPDSGPVPAKVELDAAPASPVRAAGGKPAAEAPTQRPATPVAPATPKPPDQGVARKFEE